jgi:hypothetical protein
MPPQPQTVSEYIAVFRKDLEKEFDIEDPGRTEQFYLVADHVSTKNKRQIYLYVSHAAPEVARAYTRVSYVLPVSPEGAPLFGGDDLMPAEGPTFETTRVSAGSIDTEIARRSTNEAPWAAEITRVKGVYDSAVDGSKVKRAAKNVLIFWKDLRERIYDEIYSLYIRIRRTASGRAASSATPRATSKRRSSSRSHSGPRSMVKSSTRLSSARATYRRTSTTVYKSNSDPAIQRLPRDPVTGKIIRRRRPNSDPKDEE